jgi:hypothetical protein
LAAKIMEYNLKKSRTNVRFIDYDKDRLMFAIMFDAKEGGFLEISTEVLICCIGTKLAY